MRHRVFGASGVPVPVIGQGTWNLEEDDRDTAIRALRRGFDLGLTHVDTAELYGSGAVEELVGEAINGRRDEVFLVSKVLPENATKGGVIAACERSLRRLRTYVLDCYLLHWESDHPLEETVAGFEELVRRGWIRSWGVSNFDERALARVLQVAGTGKVACNQVLYHLGERAIEHVVLPFCQEHGIAVVGYSPFGSGAFPAPTTPEGRVLAEIGERHRATPRQVALSFLLRGSSLFTIPKASDPAHVDENAAAARLALDLDDLSKLEAAFPRGPHRVGVPVL